ncbi:hypothetical protein BDQ17DRAFT_458125 [Cyathus striatus]|nr:hypothetical protein BDQ17DRAFT_458125 [Cyathus striatus]
MLNKTLLLSTLTIFLGILLRLRVLELKHDELILCSQSKNVYTVDERNPRVECMLVSKGRFGRLGVVRRF